MKTMSERSLFTSKAILLLWCQEPTHFGAGRTVGLVDLPIQRSSLSGLPIGQSTSIRGVFRSFLELSNNEGLARELFGPSPQDTPEAGHITFTDAKLLAMPVNSIMGLFCWLTSPFCLGELHRALERFKMTEREDSGVCKDLNTNLINLLELCPLEHETALVPPDSENLIDDNRLILLDGEVELRVTKKEKVEDLARSLIKLLSTTDSYVSKIFCRRIAVVNDDVFRFATRRGLEVATRIRLDYRRKAVEERGLWSEEYLPALSILFCEVDFHKRVSDEYKSVDVFLDFLKKIDGKHIFVGGKESVGKGLVYVKVLSCRGGEA